MPKPELRPVLNSAPALRQSVHEKVTSALHGLFPLDLKGRTLELKDVKVHAQDFSTEDQKKALLTGESLTEPVKGTLVLKDASGKVVDEAKNFTLLKLPYFTERHTLITDGNEYQVANMLRRKPGVYTQRSQNGELSTLFNLSKGKNFYITMVPETGAFHLEYDATKVPLYPVLRAMGVPNTDIAKHLGTGVAKANQELHGHQEQTAISKLYQKLIHPSVQKASATHEEKLQAVVEKFGQTAMSGDVTQQTLGAQHDKVTPKALLDASKKLLHVHEGKQDVDDSDSLAFKTFHSVDDFLAERLKLFGRAWSQKTRLRFTGKDKIREALAPQPFTDTVKRFVTTSTLAAVPMGINPIELIDHAVKVTSLGEGGISSDRAIPYESRLVHNTHYGVLDPIRTPESGHAGVDVRITIAAQRDEHGNLYTPVKNVRTGKIEYVSAGDQAKHVIAFPHQELKGMVDAFVAGKMKRTQARNVGYQYIHNGQAYSPATSLVPFLHNIQGNRAIMGSKMQTQALPLVERESPLVQVKSHRGNDSYEKLYAKLVVPTSPVAGTVTKIEGGRIWIRPTGDHEHETAEKAVTKVAAAEVAVHYQHDFPFPSKTYLHHDLKVKVGDKVTAGQHLAESNFTKDETLALGKNMRVAYMAWHGLNSNDAVVISEGAAKKLTSEHMYREVYPVTAKIELNKEKHKIYYGSKYSPDQYTKLDEQGVIKKGSKVNPHELLIAGLTKSEPTGADLMLGRISKSLTRPFKDVGLTWTHSFQGEVVEVAKSASQIAILVKTREPMQIGDKLAGRYGNKGVVAKIVPDAEMVRDESGHPIDVVMTSAGIISRINPGQIIEGAVGKVAEKTGKPIIVDNAASHDTVEWASDLLKKHGVKDMEVLRDPVTGRKIEGKDGKGVFVGRSYIFKLFKSTDTNFAAHGVGPYDVNEQPSKMGGEESAMGHAKMEFDALVAHNVRNILNEASTIRSQKNEEFWKALQLGHPLPTMKPSFVWNKFNALLEGAGVKVDKRGSKIKLLPMTDKDILAKSSGAIETNKTVLAKNLQPERGGLFDPNATGGPQGTKYSHIKLHEPLPNPVFEEPIRRLLGMTQTQFDKMLKEKGGKHIQSELEKIEVGKKLKELRDSVRSLTGPALNDAVKQIKYLEALKSEGLKPHEAYVINHVPVIPPMFRPILPMPNDPKQLMVSDANKLYMHLMDANQTLKTSVLDSDVPEHRGHLYNALGAVFGTHEVADDELRGQKVKGFLSSVAGVGTPKSGFFQRKIMRRSLDISGRGTAVPDVNLGMDEVGLPEDQLWGMFEPFIVARLVRTGYPAIQAKEMVEKRAPAAREALQRECQERPVYLNRAPTLHRWSIVSAFPKMVQGKTVRVSPFIEKGMNLDYDGDTLQIHAPVTHAAVKDAHKMLMSNQLLSDQQRNRLVAFPQFEAILGIAHASEAAPKGAVKTFKSVADVEAAYRRGELKLTDAVKIEAEMKKAASDEETDWWVPQTGPGYYPYGE
jgi:DNA-directed RNA polymerase beta subunit